MFAGIHLAENRDSHPRFPSHQTEAKPEAKAWRFCCNCPSQCVRVPRWSQLPFARWGWRPSPQRRLLLPGQPPALPFNSPTGSTLLSPPLASLPVFIHPRLLVEIKGCFSCDWEYSSFLVRGLPSMKCGPRCRRVPSCTNISLRLLAVSVCLSHYFWRAAKIANDEVIFVVPGLKKTPIPISVWVLNSTPAATGFCC